MNYREKFKVGGSKHVARGQRGEGGGYGGIRENVRRCSPAVWTVFFMDAIIRLSPEACKRTLVRSNGLVTASKARVRVHIRVRECKGIYCVIDAAIVAATPSEGRW
jgi:hypothetical protein